MLSTIHLLWAMQPLKKESHNIFEDEDDMDATDEQLSVESVEAENDLETDDEDDTSGTSASSDEHDDDFTEDTDEDEDSSCYEDCEEEEEDKEEIVDDAATQRANMKQLEEKAFERELRKITLKSLERGKIAALIGAGGKITDTIVHASQFVVENFDAPTLSILSVGGGGGDHNPSTNPSVTLKGNTGVSFKLLKREHKGRV